MAKTNSGLLEFKDAQKVLIALDDATSEVKKAVVIDADGVETDIQGVQPTGKKEITSTEEVNVANYATAQVVDEDLVAGNIKKDVDILGVVGSYEGGGGSSDFSTAKLTVNGNFTQSDLFMVPVIEKDPDNEDIAFPQLQSGNSTYTVILYKGRSALMFMGSQSRTITVSGNIETAATGVYIITGDCAITIS